MTSVIELDGLSVRLGQRDVLCDLTATLSGTAIGLLGPNGAGKTTLLRTLLGFHKPVRGGARVLGRDVASTGHALRRSVGHMPENESFIATMSAVRLVRYLAELSGLPPSDALERSHEVLNYVGLGEARYRPVGTYSLGMRQLVKLAQAIVHGPRLLLLDEPTNGLDPPARSRMLRLIRELAAAGVHVVVSSHLLRDVEEACDEVVILRDGRLVAHSNLHGAQPANDGLIELETLEAPELLAAALVAAGCEAALGAGRRLKVVLAPGCDSRQVYRLADGVGVHIRRYDGVRDSLETIFLKAMEGSVTDGGL